MKYIILLMLAFPMNAQALEPDKKLHIGASAVISGAIYVAARNSGEYTKGEAYAIAFIGAMIVGFGKELSDPYIDKQDIYANMAGALVAPLVLIWF